MTETARKQLLELAIQSGATASMAVSVARDFQKFMMLPQRGGSLTVQEATEDSVAA